MNKQTTKNTGVPNGRGYQKNAKNTYFKPDYLLKY
jgi:hypothetical protein